MADGDAPIIPANILIVGPTNSGKSKYVVNQLRGPYKNKFDYIVLVCPTYVYNQTYNDFGLGDNHLFVVVPEQDQVDFELKQMTLLFKGTKTLFIIDDCASTKDVKNRVSQLVNLGFSARHLNISVWVLTQQFTSISKPFRENITKLVSFYTPNYKDMYAIFDNYGGELSSKEKKELYNKLKIYPYSYIVFNLKYPYSIQLHIVPYIYPYWIDEHGHRRTFVRQ